MDGRSHEGLSPVLIPVPTDEGAEGRAADRWARLTTASGRGPPMRFRQVVQCSGRRHLSIHRCWAGEPAAIHVLIVDDHSVVRRGLRMFLEDDPELQIVGEARDGAEAVAQARELRPDVVLMDLLMPGMDG